MKENGNRWWRLEITQMLWWLDPINIGHKHTEQNYHLYLYPTLKQSYASLVIHPGGFVQALAKAMAFAPFALATARIAFAFSMFFANRK